MSNVVLNTAMGHGPIDRWWEIFIAASLHTVPLCSQSAITTAPPGAGKRLTELEKRLQDSSSIMTNRSGHMGGHVSWRLVSIHIRKHAYTRIHAKHTTASQAALKEELMSLT